MKRTPKTVYHQNVYRIFPLSWRECKKCGQEFRREWGYRVLTGPYHGGMGRWHYVCGCCAKIPIEAKNIADDPGPRPVYYPGPHK